MTDTEDRRTVAAYATWRVLHWARHRAGHTFAFDDTVAWLAVTCSKTAVCQLMRIAWRTSAPVLAEKLTILMTPILFFTSHLTGFS